MIQTHLPLNHHAWAKPTFGGGTWVSLEDHVCLRVETDSEHICLLPEGSGNYIKQISPAVDPIEYPEDRHQQQQQFCEPLVLFIPFQAN